MRPKTTEVKSSKPQKKKARDFDEIDKILMGENNNDPAP